MKDLKVIAILVMIVISLAVVISRKTVELKLSSNSGCVAYLQERGVLVMNAETFSYDRFDGSADLTDNEYRAVEKLSKNYRFIKMNAEQIVAQLSENNVIDNSKPLVFTQKEMKNKELRIAIRVLYHQGYRIQIEGE